MPHLMQESTEQNQLQKKKHKIPVFTSLLTIVLTVTLVVLGEKIMYDINKQFNSAPNRWGEFYDLNRLLIHAAIIVPFFLLTFVFYYYLHYKRQSQVYKVVSWGYIAFGVALLFHLIGETLVYMFDKNNALGIYSLLIFLVALITGIIIINQKKANMHQDE